MKLPVIKGTIARRLLVSFAVDPDVAEKLLPPPFQPKIVHDHAVAGICLIRLCDIRPSGVPAAVGIRSENAAHRIAVKWNDEDGPHDGVFIPRRDTSSLLNRTIGGRLFPGVHHKAKFTVGESEPYYSVGFKSADGETDAFVSGHATDALPRGSLFASIDEASRFFEMGSVGYSATSDPEGFDGLELRTGNWQVRPFHVDQLRSSFFEDASLFPRGSARFDNALIMNQIEHEWRALRSVRTNEVRSTDARRFRVTS